MSKKVCTVTYQSSKRWCLGPFSSVNSFAINQLPTPTIFSSWQRSYNYFYSTTGICSRKQQPCPFRTLNVKNTDSFETAKKRFLELAFRYHPDTATSAKINSQNTTPTDEDESKDEATQKFLDIRAAFKSLEETQDGGIRIKETHSITDSSSHNVYNNEEKDEDFDDWFREKLDAHKQNIYSFLDARAVRELVEVTEKYSPGGLDKGGMWDLAKAVRQKVDRDGLPPLEINSGKSTNANNDKGIGRRRRKR